MIYKDITLPTPEENILYDEVLLNLAEKGVQGEVLRFWESSEIFVVLGRIGKEEDDLNLAAIAEDKIPVLRRSSGGGTVVQGPGCVNFSLILEKDLHPGVRDIRQSYKYILSNIVHVLKTMNLPSRFYPISDIALEDNQKKFSGNAQKRGRKFILHHGTVLYDFDLSLIERYLRLPKEMPAYREKRSHLDFVTNISLEVSLWKKQMRRAFRVTQEQFQVTELEAEYL